jgi:hypothetical protein
MTYQHPGPPRPSPRDYRLAASREKSTAIHGVITACSLGLWSPVWFLACMQRQAIRRARARVMRYQATQQPYPPPGYGWPQ